MTTSTQIAIRKLPGYEEDIKKDILAGAKSLYQQSRGPNAFLPPDIKIADLSAGEKEAIRRA